MPGAWKVQCFDSCYQVYTAAKSTENIKHEIHASKKVYQRISGKCMPNTINEKSQVEGRPMCKSSHLLSLFQFCHSKFFEKQEM